LIAAAPDSDSLYAYYAERGRCSLNGQHYDEAITDLEKSLQLKNENDAKDVFIFGADERRKWIGDAYRRKGDVTMAIKRYTEAVNQNPFGMYAGRARLERGKLLAAQGDHTTAIADFNHLSDGVYIIEQVEVHAERGASYYALKDYPNAIADFTKAIELGPTPQFQSAMYFNRALAHDGSGRADLALADYDQAIALNSNDAKSHLNRAVIRHNRGEYGPAIDDYTRAIQIDPGYAPAYQNRAIAYEAIGMTIQAQQDRQRASELGVQN
jgi:tetratricopeptide (TPR) repeat protein